MDGEKDHLYTRSRQSNLIYSQQGPSSRIQSQSSKRIKPNYDNAVGPGDYNMPSFSATMYMPNSENRNAPIYTLGPKTKQPYFPQFEVDFKGRDAPSMDTYNPSFTSTKVQTPAYSAPKQSRFHQLKGKAQMIAQLPS
jgi:hypothetical protein